MYETPASVLAPSKAERQAQTVSDRRRTVRQQGKRRTQPDRACARTVTIGVIAPYIGKAFAKINAGGRRNLRPGNQNNRRQRRKRGEDLRSNPTTATLPPRAAPRTVSFFLLLLLRCASDVWFHDRETDRGGKRQALFSLACYLVNANSDAKESMKRQGLGGEDITNSCSDREKRVQRTPLNHLHPNSTSHWGPTGSRRGTVGEKGDSSLMPLT